MITDPYFWILLGWCCFLAMLLIYVCVAYVICAQQYRRSHLVPDSVPTLELSPGQLSPVDSVITIEIPPETTGYSQKSQDFNTLTLQQNDMYTCNIN